ncbi:SGNH/GDSL hydrolase family protein [uncultured Bacteroides sp.]|uniref:SGNH/GDSL hydrolase family protein n=1 Tax=uncultured Bacteroides sp. TaxID=162156 RepID=UPI002AAB5BC1|nr:SGNH/GDSL hydrolase family protein [uncultured Bacteroides sp.]
MRKIVLSVVSMLLLVGNTNIYAQQPRTKGAPKVVIENNEKTLSTQWKGKKVAFLGDSMTDKRRVGTTCVYWEYLSELLGIEPSVYGISGNQWNDIYKQAIKLYEQQGEAVDAILIFAGTNDYNHGIPMGQFFTESMKETNYNGKQVMRKFRTPIMNDSTFCGRVNKAMAYLKDHFPQQQIIIMTPIHRSFAQFNNKNVQPAENFCNPCGIYLESYVDALKQAASMWAVPLIDLYSISGLYPLADSQSQYFHNATMDRLHPNALGDYRLAKTIQYQLLTLPSSFVLKAKK